MDITKSENKIFLNKLFNGETVNYGICFFISVFLFSVLRQLLKLTFGISAPVAVLVSYIVAAALLYFLEKKYVFIFKVKAKTAYQLILAAVRTGIGVGFYKLCGFVFGSILNAETGLVFFITGTILFFFNYFFDKLLVFDCRSNPLNNYRGRAYKLFSDNRFVLLSMLLAGLGIGFTYITMRAFPFGNVTVLRMDLYHQYGPLYCELYDRITDHQSFLYSWTSGGGTSFLGNYFNYLSSPLSFIALIFNRDEMPYAISLMVFIKAVLSAGAFTYYINRSQKSYCLTSAAFGSLYAFCSYFLAYYWNIMWIDGMILFPFVMLGIERIIDNGKPLTYIASLTILLYSTYYIGFMTCIFAVIYFFAYYAMSKKPAAPVKAAVKQVRNDDSDGKKKVHLSFKPFFENRLINRGIVFAYSSLIAGALCAVTLIPVYFILQSSSATSDAMPSTFESYYDILTLITSHLTGLTTTIRSSGEDVLPNIYCGTLPAILLPLYIMNKKISLKEKAVYVLLIIFFVFSFNNNIANYLWHANHFPNDLPFRFSFMYSFIILVIAYKTLSRLRGLSYSNIAVAGMFWLMLTLYFQKDPTEKMNDYTVYITIAFTIIWTGVLLLIKKGHMPKVILGLTVTAIVFCEVLVADTPAYLIQRPYDEYMTNYKTYRESIDYVEDSDKDFYRQELCYLDTRMDPCLYGYNGISVFSSMAYEKYSGLQYSLGMLGNRINSYTYNTQTPVYNAMFNIKYLTHTDQSLTPSNDYYAHYYSAEDGKSTVYQNKYYLPIAFETSSDIEDWYCEEGNPFEVQEDFIDRAAGVSDVFVPCEFVSTETSQCDCEDVTENGVYSFSKDADIDGGTISITIKAVNNGNLYVYLSSPEIDNVNFYWNDDEYTENQNIDEPYIKDLGKHKKGDEIRIELSLADMENESSVVDVYAYNIDKEVFESAYDLLNEGALEVTAYNDTSFEGTINAGFDGILYTSVPFDEGWSVYVDGKKAKTFEIGDCMLGANIKEGKHTVKFKYVPKGFKYGAVISVAAWLCVLVYGAYCVIVKKSKKETHKADITVNN